MRVISGQAGGRRLTTLEGEEVTRPTGGKVKEAIFSSIRFNLPGKTFLDLFSGSGQMAIEAVSLGASEAVAIELNRNALSVLRENVKSCGFDGKIEIRQADAYSYLESTNKTFDIAFLDPPYRKQMIDRALPLLVPKMSRDGIILCEISSEESLPESCGEFVAVKRHKYSNTTVVVYKWKE